MAAKLCREFVFALPAPVGKISVFCDPSSFSELLSQMISVAQTKSVSEFPLLQLIVLPFRSSVKWLM